MKRGGCCRLSVKQGAGSILTNVVPITSIVYYNTRTHTHTHTSVQLNPLTAGLHANKAALDEVNAADSVLSAKLVEGCQEGGRAHLDAVDCNGIALLKLDLDLSGLVRGLVAEVPSCLLQLARETL